MVTQTCSRTGFLGNEITVAAVQLGKRLNDQIIAMAICDYKHIELYFSNPVCKPCSGRGLLESNSHPARK